MYQMSRRLLGRHLVDFVANRTFYSQFVGGNDLDALRTVAAKLSQAGLGIQLAVPIEDPIDPQSV